MAIRALKPGDEKLLEEFLSGYAETSMFLRSNLQASGLNYKDEKYHGEYIGSFLKTGEMDGVLVHYWNGSIMMQAPSKKVLEKLINSFRKIVTRPISGILGENEQAEVVINGLSISNQEYAVNRSEGLYSLDLKNLSLPFNPAENHYNIIDSCELERSLLTTWIRDYEIEALGAEDNEALDMHAKDKVDKLINNSNCWALIVDGRPVSLSAFNAKISDIIQIGPVWTPREYRSKGYARALVALTLHKALQHGITKAILFTDNPAAIKAYKAIGFTKIGAYRLALLKASIMLHGS